MAQTYYIVEVHGHFIRYAFSYAYKDKSGEHICRGAGDDGQIKYCLIVARGHAEALGRAQQILNSDKSAVQIGSPGGVRSWAEHMDHLEDWKRIHGTPSRRASVCAGL